MQRRRPNGGIAVYDALYDAWLREKQAAELQSLSKDFYSQMAEYIGRIRQEGRMLDQKSTKARLITQELSKVKRLTKELIKLRFRKLVESAATTKPVPREALTLEEETLLAQMKPSLEDFQSLWKALLRGKAAKAKEPREPPKKRLLRFLQEAPSIVGADLKVYGPFSPEDVATLPVENAKVLVKQGVAMEIDTG
jgi:DNA replication initiation complex subunit (GINS family)